MIVKHKFNATRAERDGIKFPSKKERNRYDELKLLQSSGKVLFFLMQTPFHLVGNVKYLLDFTIFWADGTVTFEDVKGVDTPISKLKRKQVTALYGVEIELT